jgi:starch synthase
VRALAHHRSERNVRILFVASESFPLAKTGGLADVVGALPLALAKHDCDVRVLLPAYRGVLGKLGPTEEVASYGDLFGGPARLLAGDTADGLRVLALDAPHLYDRPGTLYLDTDGRDYPDNIRRFAALSAIGAAVGRFGAGDFKPDIVHCHDWQSGLVPAYLAAGADEGRPKTVFTIHNVAFQGLCGRAEFSTFGLPDSFYTPAGLEYYGGCSLLKSGLVFSDRITTVSPTYALELRTAEFGLGMEGVLNERSDVFSGIINGIDTAIWDPSADKDIAADFSARKLAGKARCKADLQARMGLAADPEAPLVIVVSRLTGQKGFDLLLPLIDDIVRHGGQLAVLGSGEAGMERAFTDAASRYPGRVAVYVGYNEPLSHVMQAGADAILIPSRFEPCGLTQLYALRYGTLPVVARTGGLADTVIDANDAAIRSGVATGIQFAPINTNGLRFALERLFALHADKKVWKTIQLRAMSHPVGWEDSALEYIALYADLLG